MSNTKISNMPHTQGGLGCHIFTLLKGKELLFTSLANLPSCHSELSQESEESLLSAKDSLNESLKRQPLCHHEPPIRGKELLSKTPKSTTSDSCRDSSLDFSSSRHDKLCYPQGKPTHNKHLQGNLLCHSKHCEESQPESPATPLVCHSEGARSGGEESLPESLVAKRDSSPLAGVQNDKITSLAGSQVCHSEGFMPEESLQESPVAHSNSSLRGGYAMAT